MEALFTNPLTMLAGAALVSSPILIHLINRMRFRRIRWAAMEFLLKAQKRMRRKLIIEQLILLLLRCLLVALVGLLLARFKWFSSSDGTEGRATAHVVILDDTPSMADSFAAEGRRTTAFEQAKTQVTEKIAPAAAQANTPQSLDILLLSDLATPRAFDRLNDTSIQDARAYLAPLRPSAVRVSLIDGLRKAKEVFERKPDSDAAKVIHVVSDLRTVDWVEDGEALKQLITELTAEGIRIHLIDVAHPYRKETDRQPQSSDNLGIVEFRSTSRVVARFQRVEFELRVKNSGSTEQKDVKVHFFLNGRGNILPTVTIPSIPANQERTELVIVQQFDRIGTKDNPLDRFNLVTAVIADDAGALTADNVRHAVVEVQERLAVLVVEGRERERDTPQADGFFLRRLFENATGELVGKVQWVAGRLADLEKQDLRQYVAIYLLNVPGLSESQRDKLEGYIRDGGGVGVFLGPDVRAADYNKILYRSGEGAFPVPLPDKPTDPPTEEQRNKIGRAFSKKVLTLGPAVKSHPAVIGFYKDDRGAAVKDLEVERFFMFPKIDQYWPVKRFGKWLDDKAIQELFCLPNEQPMAQFQGSARDLLDKLKAKAAEPKFEKYRQYLDPLDKRIRSTTADDSQPLSVLADHYDRLLCDQINDGDPSEPILREFWGQPELIDLRAEFQRERNRVKFGDPLYVVKQFGKGRMAVMLTDAGAFYPSGRWTDWPSGAGAGGWSIVVTELQKYLSSGAVEVNRLVGSPVTANLEATKYKPSASRVFVSADPAAADKTGNIPVTVSKPETFPLEATGGSLAFRHPGSREVGVELWTFIALSGTNGEIEKPEYVAYAYNLDSQREGDLRRVTRDDLAQYAPKVPLYSPDDTSWMNNLKQKRDDFSTRRWLYLFILLVLVAEQAMAVRLSFHARPEDVEAHAPSAAAAYARGTAPVDPADADVAPPVETASV